MELREYVAVLTRRWKWLVWLVAIGLTLAAVTVVLTPHTWTADTEVFVSSSQEGTAGSQFVSQRVKSYPDVATSAEVLDPVRESLGLDTTVAALRAAITAVNPADTSQVNVSVVDSDPERAAAIADAVAAEFVDVVQRLETTATGTQPVTLTVTNPATVPTSPTSPRIALLLALGLVCGLGAGLACAVLRDRVDQRVWSVPDVQAAWGAGVPEVLPPPARRTPADRAAHVLARRIERRAGTGTVRVLLVSPTTDGTPAVDALLADLGRVLGTRGVEVHLTSAPDATSDDDLIGSGRRDVRAADVELTVIPADAALTRWRAAVATADGVVVVCPVGRADRVDVFELAQLLEAVGAPTVAVVLTSRSGRRAGPLPSDPDSPSGRRTSPVDRPPDETPAVATATPGHPTSTTARRVDALRPVRSSWAPLTPASTAPVRIEEPAVTDPRPVAEPAHLRTSRVAGARRASVAAAPSSRRITARIPDARPRPLQD